MFRSLQAGRGIAALAVAGFHLTYVCGMLPTMRNSTLAVAFKHANAGVDFFFVLSGFIIMFAHGGDIGQPNRFGRYVRNRFVRVYPIYWVYTAAIVTAIVAGVSTIGLPVGPIDWLSTLSLVRLSHVATPLNVAWTLFYEVAFYAVFGVLILSRKAGIALLMAWFAAIVYFHLYASEFGIGSVLVSRLCLNFFVGMAACWLHTRIGRPTAWAALTGGLLALAFAFVTVDHGLPADAFAPLVAVSCGMAITGAAAFEREARWNVGLLAALGDASYTLYLVHAHLQSIMMKAMVRLPVLSDLPPDVLFVGVLAANAVIAYGLYVVLERPLVRMVKSWRPSFVPTATTAQNVL